RLVTPRYFETPAASTIPLFGLDAAYVQEIYGEQALEMVLPAEKPEDKIADLLRRPGYYGEIVRGIRRHMRAKHSHTPRLKELIEILESYPAGRRHALDVRPLPVRGPRQCPGRLPFRPDGRGDGPRDGDLRAARPEVVVQLLPGAGVSRRRHLHRRVDDRPPVRRSPRLGASSGRGTPPAPRGARL